MLISTALLLDSIIRNSVCTPAKLPCRRVEVGYEIPTKMIITTKKKQKLMKQEILPINSLLDETSPQRMENNLSAKVSKLRKKNATLNEKEIITSDFEENNPANASHYEEEETLISEPSKRVDYTLDDLMNESVEENRSTQGKMLDTDAYEQYLQTFGEVPRQYIDTMI
jgi:hypothetical protein